MKGATLMGGYYGIDLGMTNICIATVNDGDVEIVKNNEGEFVTPSVIRFEKDGSYWVGQIAKESALPDGIAVEEILSHMRDLEYCVEVGGKKFSSVELLSLMLVKIKKDLDIQGEIAEDVVLTCPVYFGAIEKENMKAAGATAGLNVLSVISYPVAALFSYGTDMVNKSGKKVFLVYDLGGTAFEITALEVEITAWEDGLPEGNIRVLTADGHERLGGKDWDRRLTERIIKKTSEALDCDEAELWDEAELCKEIKSKSEATKKILCGESSANRTVKIAVSTRYGRTRVEITSEEFEDITEDLLDRTIALTNGVLDWLEQNNKRLDEVILVGGATQMPQVKKALLADKRLADLMGEVVITQSEPDTAVAKGAALWAQLRGTERDL